MVVDIFIHGGLERSPRLSPSSDKSDLEIRWGIIKGADSEHAAYYHLSVEQDRIVFRRNVEPSHTFLSRLRMGGFNVSVWPFRDLYWTMRVAPAVSTHGTRK